MVNAIKLKSKLNKKIFNKLGSDLIVNNYTVNSRDAFGKKTNVLASSVTIKAVKENSLDISQAKTKSSQIKEGDISLLISGDNVYIDTTNSIYEYIWGGSTYILLSTVIIGDIQGLFEGVVRKLHLRLK